jgi:hypothetical protein
VSLSAPTLTHSVSTTFIEYKCQPPCRGGGGAATPAVQLNSIFSAKTDPRENPGKNHDKKQISYLPTYLSTYLPIPTYQPTYLPTFLLIPNIPTCLPTIACKNNDTFHVSVGHFKVRRPPPFPHDQCWKKWVEFSLFRHSNNIELGAFMRMSQ